MRPQTFAVSATPGSWEMEQSGGVFAEQVIRPTGLIDPPVEIKPVEDQVQDCIQECLATAKLGYRTLVTTLTKRMAEDLTEFMHEAGVRVRYMHSDVETLERIELIRDLRLGVYDVLIGINLLREGLDIPECGLVAILDADKEGFLRSETSLIQTIGRAARNVDGRVILYADRITGSMERAMAETERRREKQRAYNEEHGITPRTIKRDIADIVAHSAAQDGVTVDIGDDEVNNLVGHNLRAYIEDLEKRMRNAAADLEFEEAGRLRDEIRRLENDELGPAGWREKGAPCRAFQRGQTRHAQAALRSPDEKTDGPQMKRLAILPLIALAACQEDKPEQYVERVPLEEAQQFAGEPLPSPSVDGAVWAVVDPGKRLLYGKPGRDTHAGAKLHRDREWRRCPPRLHTLRQSRCEGQGADGAGRQFPCRPHPGRCDV